MATIELLRIRDKRLEVDETVFAKTRRQSRSRNRHFDGNNVRLKGIYAEEHESRVKSHQHRVAEEEGILLENGINPQRAGSAFKLDCLIRRKMQNPKPRDKSAL